MNPQPRFNVETTHSPSLSWIKRPRLVAVGRNRLWVVFWAGLLARLLCMPFLAHSDLLSVYWRSHMFLDEGLRLGISPIQILHDLFLWGLAPLLPSPETTWPPGLRTVSHLTLSQIENWALVIQRPQIYRALFLFKLPYLVFDVGCVTVLSRLYRGESRRQLRAMTFWWLNPVLMFSTYSFARHDVIALFFMLASLLAFRRNRSVASLLLLGVAVALRLYAIFLLPFYVLAAAPSGWKRLKLLAAGMLFYLLLDLAFQLSRGFSPTVQRASWSKPHSFLLAAQLPLSSWDTIYLFPLVYILLLLHCVSNTSRNFHNLQRYGLVSLLLLFSTAASGQSPHYWTWFIPFLTMVVTEDMRIMRLSCLQTALLVVYSFIGGRSTAGYLLASISPDFFWGLPSPAEAIARHVAIDALISLARTALSAVTLWMAYLAFRQIKTSIPLYPGRQTE